MDLRKHKLKNTVQELDAYNSIHVKIEVVKFHPIRIRGGHIDRNSDGVSIFIWNFRFFFFNDRKDYEETEIRQENEQR